LRLTVFNDTHKHGKNPLEEGSARRRDLYLYDTQHSQETEMNAPPVGFEPLISASGRPQRHALDSEATGIGQIKSYATIIEISSHFTFIVPRIIIIVSK